MFRRRATAEEGPRPFVDLGEAGEATAGTYGHRLLVAEVLEYGDMKKVMDRAYKGNPVVADMSRFSSGDDLRLRAAGDLRQVAKDTGGSMMSVGDNLLVYSPPGTGLEKLRVR